MLLWLVPIGATSLFANGRWITPLAAWLAPVLLLGFMRRAGWLGAGAAWLTQLAVGLVAWYGLVPLPGFWHVAVVGAIQTWLFLPYVVDRWLSRALGYRRVLATFVLPAAAVTAEYTLSSASPWGTWCIGAYAHDDLRLLQLLSLTGMWGLTFLVAWLAAVVDLALREHEAGRPAWRALALYASVAGAAYTYGAARLHLVPPAPTVRVAWLARPPSAAAAEYGRFIDAIVGRGSFDYDLQESEVDRVRPAMAAIRDDLVAGTEREARAGARLVFWSEAAAPVLEPELARGSGRAELLAAAGRVAAGTGAHVGVALAVDHARPVRTENELALVGPSGDVVLDFHKAHPVFPLEAAATVGPRDRMTVVSTAVGRVSAAICHDFDFHRLFFDAGRGAAELVLDPAGDWEAIFPVHSHMARYRAIEQGFSLVRGVKWGHSFACDGYGRMLASVDDRRGDNGVMIAAVPARHTTTVYSRIGDALAWACLAGLGALVGLGVTGRRA